MSLTQWFTRSAPTVSCRFMAKAIFNFVPTPSTLATSTGSRIPEKFGANSPPKPPIFPSTSGPCVPLTRAWIRRLTQVAEIDVDPGAGVGFFLLCHPSEAKISQIRRTCADRHRYTDSRGHRCAQMTRPAAIYFRSANKVGCASSAASALARPSRFSMMNLSSSGSTGSG